MGIKNIFFYQQGNHEVGDLADKSWIDTTYIAYWNERGMQ